MELEVKLMTLFPKFGFWTTNVEMLKVRKTAKFDLNSWVGISRTTTARASKSCVVLSLELSNISPKTGVWSKNGVELLKVRTKAKCDLNSWGDISRNTKHPNFVWYFDLNLATFSQILVS